MLLMVCYLVYICSCSGTICHNSKQFKKLCDPKSENASENFTLNLFASTEDNICKMKQI